jgi:hypothetical protein
MREESLEGALRGVPVFTVRAWNCSMPLLLHTRSRTACPVDGRRPTSLATTLTDVVAPIDRLDESSDAVLTELLSFDLDDPLVVPVMLLGLRLLIVLCRRRDSVLLNDLVTEVVIVTGEMRRVRTGVWGVALST